MTAYTRGANFERELINLLEANGYSCIRGAGSKGEVFGMKADLIATKETNKSVKQAIMVIVQCKLKKKKLESFRHVGLDTSKS